MFFMVSLPVRLTALDVSLLQLNLEKQLASPHVGGTVLKEAPSNDQNELVSRISADSGVSVPNRG